MWVSNQCCILKIIGRTKVKQMLCFDNSRIQGEINPCGFSCCTFQGDGSVVVYPLFLIAPDVCGFLCLVPVFVMQYLMSFLVFFTLEERAGCFTGLSITRFWGRNSAPFPMPKSMFFPNQSSNGNVIHK